jgi:hypothetical protein
MSAGNQNKYSLDELEFIPGEVPFKKDTSWNKLQERMGEKKTNKTYRYLAAASIVIVLSAGIMLWNNGKRTEVERNEVGGNEVHKNEVVKDDVVRTEVDRNDIEKNDLNKNDATRNEPISITDSQNSSTQTNHKSGEVIKGKKLTEMDSRDNTSIAGDNNSSTKKSTHQKKKSDFKISIGNNSNSVANVNADSSQPLAKSPDVVNAIPFEIPQNETAARLQPVKKKLKVLHQNQLVNTYPIIKPEYSARSGNMQSTTVFGRNKSDDFIKIKITTPN